MVRRNSAFRIAIGGLSLSVLLCLVAAISLVNSSLTTEVRDGAPQVVADREALPSATPIQVATVGDVGHLLHESKPVRPVPEPSEIVPADTDSLVGNQQYYGQATHSEAGQTEEGSVSGHESSDSESNEPETDAPELDTHTVAQSTPPGPSAVQVEIDRLRDEVKQLARDHLESQIAEIRHSEQLLSAHQSQRLIESLQREIDDLKLERSATVAVSTAAAAVSTAEDEGQESVPFQEGALLQNDSTDLTEPSSQQAVDPDVFAQTSTPRQSSAPSSAGVEPVDPSSNRIIPDDAAILVTSVPSDTRPASVRFLESSEQPGRYDVDADHATLTEFITKLGPLAGWNLVAGPKLEGNVSCRWRAVDLKVALSQQLKAHGLRVREDGEFAIIESDHENDAVVTTGEATSSDELPPITLDLETEPQEETASVYDQTTGILIQPKLPPYSPVRDRPRVMTRVGSNATRAKPAVPVRRIGALPESQKTVNGTKSAHSSEVIDKAAPSLPIIEQQSSESVVDGLPQNLTQSLPRFRVEASILEVRPAPGTVAGIAGRALSVQGRGACPQCGQNHGAGNVALGHAADGWYELHDGVQCAVTSMGSDSIVSRLQEFAVTTVTSTPHVEVLDRQFAEVGLTEQPGFRRQILQGDSRPKEVSILQGGVRLALRPMMTGNGDVELAISNVSVQALATEASTMPVEPIIQVPVTAEQCVVVGGLYFEDISTSPPTTRAKRLSALLSGKTHDRNTHEVVIVIRVVPIIEESGHHDDTTTSGALSNELVPPRIVPPALIPQLLPPSADSSIDMTTGTSSQLVP